MTAEFNFTPKVSEMFPDITDRDDWEYRDLPWMTKGYFTKLLEWIGDGEYMQIIGSSRNDWDGGPFFRGQFFVSPKGLENLVANHRRWKDAGMPDIETFA